VNRRSIGTRAEGVSQNKAMGMKKERENIIGGKDRVDAEPARVILQRREGRIEGGNLPRRGI